MKKLPILLVISLIFSNLEVPNNKYCIMITESKVTEIFCIADDFCKEFEGEMAKNALNAFLKCFNYFRVGFFTECRG